MTGLYLYCVKEKDGSRLSVKGMGGGKIFTVPYQDLEAVVSEVSLAEFGSEQIQKKAQENLGWIKEKALAHEKVIEEAMGVRTKDYSHVPIRIAEGRRPKAGCSHTVIPMKFGTIFKTKKKLDETLKKHHSKFKKTLKNLEGKQEWSVKVYLNQKPFIEEVKKNNPVVRAKEAELSSTPEGIAYFKQKQIDEIISSQADGAVRDYVKIFFESFKKYAAAALRGKILEKELTGTALPMVLNAIYLVPGEKIKNFKKEVTRLEKEYKLKGFNFTTSGPWPAYNFV